MLQLGIDLYICICSDSDKQLERLIARNELSETEARHRVESQMPLEIKCEKSHFVIDNNGDKEEAEASAMNIYNMMRESKQHWLNRISFLGLFLIVGFAIYLLLKVFNRLPESWQM